MDIQLYMLAPVRPLSDGEANALLARLPDALRERLAGQKGGKRDASLCAYEMLRRAVASCEQVGATYHVGNVLSTDNFYNDDEGMPEVLQTVPAWIKMGVMACEMEAAGLYMTAARWKKNALCICTISDHIYRAEALSSEQRQISFTQMMEIALDTAVKMAQL